MVTAAVSGQADIVATSASHGRADRRQEPGPRLRAEDPSSPISTWRSGVKKGEPKLLEKLNAWITENLKNGKLNAIYKKYYGADLPEAMRS